MADVNFGAVLLEDVIPFWVRHGWDQLYGGVITSLDRDGSVLDTDKSVWFQGRAGWMFATLYNTVSPDPQWLEIAQSCVDFLDRFGSDVPELSARLEGTSARPAPKLYFTVTRDGKPLRMRRYYYSESFAAIL